MPIKNPDRALFASIALISVVATSLLLSTLTNGFTVGTKVNQISSLEDLDESNLKLMMTQNYVGITFGQETTDATRSNLANKVIYSEDLLNCANILLKYRNVFCVALATTVDAILAITTESGEQTIGVLEESIWNGYKNLCFARDSPLVDIFYRMLVRFFESGLLTKSGTDFIAEGATKSKRLEDFESNNKVQEGHTKLRSIVFLALTGYCLSIVVFVAELLSVRLPAGTFGRCSLSHHSM